MMNKRTLLRMAASSVLVGVALIASVAPASSQTTADISFASDLPRTLVFVAEEGNAGVAARGISDFLREAGFPLIDPALAHTAAQRDLVQQALAGDEGAATDLGRDFGAQVLIIGRADWGARPDPMDGTLITATSEVAVRALRLDRGRVIASASMEGREIEATEQAAKTAAIREATDGLLLESSFVGQLINNWIEVPWEDTEYWRPDPGSLPARVEAAQGGQAPALAILLADVRPATEGAATRGLGVIQKGNRSSSLFNPIRLEGVVVGEARDVRVEGKPANLVDLSEDEARRLGLAGWNAKRFWSEMNLPMSQDTVRVTATGPGGAVAEAVAAPRVDERWAVVVGVGEYWSEDIPDLEFATADAQAIRDFLTSSAAGPFEEDHVLYLTDERATGAAIREALFVFLQQADWDDLVVIYFAGHGAPDPNRPDNLYLLPYDSDLNALAATGFPMWDVKTALRRQISAERVIVIADACHSAGTQEGVAGPVSYNPIAGGFAQLFTPSRRLSITAADSNEFSMEDARWGGHGVFTHFFLEALEGKGDLDGNGIVTFSEAYEYVVTGVVSATEGRQNPQRAGWGDIPLAVVERGGGTLP